MLSAHRPLADFTALATQLCGGVPVMCDGITRGGPGMELSLFARDVIAMATGVALSHEMFDGALLLGVCEKIAPGLVGAGDRTPITALATEAAALR